MAQIFKDTLSDFTKISSINSNCEELHITRAFSKKNLTKILTRCLRLKTLTVSNSTNERISKALKEFIKKKGITILIRKEQGRPIDIKVEKLQKILQQYKDYSYRDLEQKLGIPKSKIHYLIKYSKRKKIKDGNKIIYLKWFYCTPSILSFSSSSFPLGLDEEFIFFKIVSSCFCMFFILKSRVSLRSFVSLITSDLSE